ncbi:cytochrome P450 [Amycolatopsis sp. DG1A-15b]|uniref:cytochrome P450 n=1 Tax=Amycolatopsis sp. DG1A-15b TaxID=3052846 RepID=UPI00255C0373|nr:cytochrome P450 [Amycolatopsis sp. DG1A-15b]WIX93026.1 cytochrome P450 [Amycolatopsis sp. DG1A-15b]
MRIPTSIDAIGDNTIDLDAVDLVDPRTYSEGDPHPIWAEMRRREPVRWHPVGSDLGFWSVTTYEHGSWVLRDHETFTSQRGTLLNLLGKDDPAGGQQMAATDPPKHTRMREPLQRALTIKSVERSGDQIRAQVRRLLEPAKSGEPFDLAQAVTRLPMAVTGMLMGLPEEDWPRLTQLTLMSIAPDDPEFNEGADTQTALQRAHRELFAYFAEIVRARQKNPGGDDLISLLLTIDVEGRTMGLGEVLANCYSLLLGANVTTPYVPTAALDAVIGTPLLHEVLESANTGTILTTVEEALRWASPANHFMRHAVRDVDLGGRQVRSGDAVVVWLGSANRDETAFEDPFTFNPRRKPNRHIAFGVGGHYCVGHTVARVTLRALFDEIVSTFADLDHAGEVEHLSSNFVAGIKHMPVIAKVRG